MAGLLEFYPAFKRKLELRYLDFPRPELIEILGEENQSCLVLVLRAAPEHSLATPPLQQAHSRWFVEGANEIATYLARAHRIGIPH